MVIVYDMRSGEVIEQSSADLRETTPGRDHPIEWPRIAMGLQLIERVATERGDASMPDVLLGCYFDESGE